MSVQQLSFSGENNGNVAMDFIVQCSLAEHDSKLLAAIFGEQKVSDWIPKAVRAQTSGDR